MDDVLLLARDKRRRIDNGSWRHGSHVTVGAAFSRIRRTATAGRSSVTTAAGAAGSLAAMATKDGIQQANAATLLAAGGLATAGRFATAIVLGFAATRRRGFATAGGFTITAAGMTAASTDAQHSVEQLEPEALGTQSDAQNERCNENVPLHRATSPCTMELPGLMLPRFPPHANR